MRKIYFSALIFIGLVVLTNQKNFAISNPWIDCGDDISCGANKAGFNFPLRVNNYSVRAMKDMMEISFPIDRLRFVTVRKSQNFEGKILQNGIVDISGVYNKYPVNKLTYLKNGIAFWTRGEKNKFYVANFAAESGYYSFYCKKGLRLRDLEKFYRLLEEAEAPRHSYDEAENYTIEQLQDLRRVDGIVEPVYSQDYLAPELVKKGVTKQCFERANLGQDSYCSESELKMIKSYYKN